MALSPTNDSDGDTKKIIDVANLIAEYNTRQGSNKQDAGMADIDYLIGAGEFKAFIKECEKLAPQINKHGTHNVFTSQAYLYSLNDGCGLTTYLNVFAEVVDKLVLIKNNGKMTVAETALNAQKDEKERDVEIQRVLSIFDGIRLNSKLLCIDISEWLTQINEPSFRTFLRKLEDHIGNNIIVFRVPFLEKNILDSIRHALNDVLTVRAISFIPFCTDELIQLANKALGNNGFTLADDALPVFTARIAEEKADGRFYGINTVNKIVREMIYLKELSTAESDHHENETIIQREDIALLAENSDFELKTAKTLLDELIGLEPLKQRINEIISQIEISRKGQFEVPCMHMRFIGNPGTGKTTVARILGRVLKEKGVLRNGNFFEYSGRDLCGRYIGETAPKTASMCRDAYGSVLFIDEAYSLYSDNDSRDYGKEAITTLIAEMENHRSDLLVIMAGYTDDMDSLMKSNSGLESRMPFVLEFPNYTREELSEIFFSMIGSNFVYNDEFISAVNEYFSSMSDETINSKKFSNARFVRNLFERTWGKAILRRQLTDEATPITLRKEDFIQASSEGEFKRLMEKKKRGIGF